MYERSGGRRSSMYEGDNNDPAGDYNRSAYGFNTSRSVFQMHELYFVVAFLHAHLVKHAFFICFSCLALYVFVTHALLLFSLLFTSLQLLLIETLNRLACLAVKRRINHVLLFLLFRDGRRRDTDRSRIEDPYYSAPRDR